MNSEDTQIIRQLSGLVHQMEAVILSIEELKAATKEGTAVAKSVAELTIHHIQQAKDIAALEVANDDCKASVITVDRKADEWINKFKGSWFTLLLLGGLAQTIVLGLIVWTFNNIRTVQDLTLTHELRLKTIEMRVTK